MKSKFFKNLSIPYPYLFHTKRNLIIACVLSIIIFLINYYSPQNTSVSNVFLVNKLYACLSASFVTFLSILFFTEFVPKVFFTAEIKESWNTVREFFFTLGILISIALFQNSFLYPLKNVSNSNFFLSLVNTFIYVILIGTVPIFIIIWVNYVIILKENLRSVKAYNKELEKELKQKDKNVVLSIKTNNVNETLILDLTTFLFAKSEGNYVDIYTKNIDSVDVKPYRISIQKLLNSLSDYSFILSTHRSYIINIKNIRRTSGNARNYKISFPDVSHEVPVSRSKFKLFKEEFDKYYK
ncbi:LytTR family DNA-binding domain-containing protein [Tenacibaculum larymnensis]|uniref:LytTR family transcriptional regulator n=1 Tax=Tenacibaculum larymnensis TaxID=2878201 RepID=A0A9X4IR55_9FLAO|nr:LytTR family DNA-binding domain-containing protein [Tenacibaculum larymnensis]MDE1207866.1 LytTR family transcriptional regulator [Tenacibaculum larymnensis]